MKKEICFAIVSVTLLASCAMPTKPEQISGVYISPKKYQDYSCEDLETELSALSRRENQLVVAQTQRYESSQVQAFLWGFGEGDGIEALELANVRGEREALLMMFDEKKCD